MKEYVIKTVTTYSSFGMSYLILISNPNNSIALKIKYKPDIFVLL